MEQKQFNFPDADAGYTCECCGSYIKVYHRKLNSNMAIALNTLYQSGIKGFVKMEDFLLEKGLKRCGDFSYLRHYGFITKMIGKRVDGSSRNGYYKITEEGARFCRKEIAAREKFVISKNKFHGFEGKEIYINEVPKFNYSELMQDELKGGYWVTLPEIDK